jgi:hypothetical protein
MLPMLVGLVLILVRVNTAIQGGIVNQQYGRAHALWLTMNSPVYPQLKLRIGNLDGQKDNQMVIGVSGNPAPSDGTYTPEAQTAYVARKKHASEQADEKNPDRRANVRIRNSVTLCTQANVVQGQSGKVPVLELDPKTFQPKGRYNLSEDAHQFKFCDTTMNYVNTSDGG